MVKRQSNPTRIENIEEMSASKGEQRVHERYNVGDIELVSSDDVLFRVKAMYLAVGSRVFRNMFEDDNKNAGPITLTDEICETSTVLEVFLDLLHGGSLPLLIEGTNTHIQAVIALARKYDCPGMLYTLNSVLRGAVLDYRFDKVDLFIALSHFEDVSGCAEAIRRHGHNHIEKTARRGSSTLTQPLPDLAWANPAAWNYERASRANFRFLFALFRAVYTVTPLLYTATRITTTAK